MEVKLITTRKYQTPDGQEFVDLKDANNHLCALKLIELLEREDVVANAGGWTNELVVAFIIENIEEIRQALTIPKVKEIY